MPPSRGVIQNVIMYQGRRVDHLDHRRQHVVRCINLTHRLSRQQQQHGPQAFTAISIQMVQNIGHVGMIGPELTVEDDFHFPQIVSDQAENGCLEFTGKKTWHFHLCGRLYAGK